MANPLVLIVLAVLTIQGGQPAAQAPQKPPDCSAAAHRQFDLWIGTWDVVPNGAQQPGPPMTNVITSEYNGCVIVERWTGAALTGSSSTSTTGRAASGTRAGWTVAAACTITGAD